jgi:antitoxin ParD1/3/4
LIQKKVETGLYQTASEVVREAIRLLDHQEKSREAIFADIRSKLTRGIKQMDEGDSVSEEELLEHLIRRRNRHTAG